MKKELTIEDIKNENAELKKVIADYKKELTDMDGIINRSKELLTTINNAGHIMEINRVGEHYFGQPVNQIVGQSLYSFFEDQSILQLAVEECKKNGEVIGIEGTLKEKYGEEIIFLINLYAMKEKQDRFFLELRDISQNTNYENQLETLIEERTKKLQQTLILLKSSLESPQGMIIMAIDHNYNYLYFNETHKQAMKNAYGADVEVGMNIMECISIEEDIKHAKENYDKALSGISHTTVQEYGEKLISYFESNYNPIYDDHKKIIGMCVFAKDISNRMRMQKRLEESEQSLEMFFNQSLTGFFIMKIDRPVYWNDEIDKEEVLDYIIKKEYVEKANQAFLDQYGYEVEDLRMITPLTNVLEAPIEVRAIWKEMLDKGYLRSITKEHKKDGTPLLIEGDYICMYDEEGRFIGHFGTQQDVTEREKRIAQIEYISNHDVLTGLFNRRSFMLQYEKLNRENNRPIGMMMIDINSLKILNDAYGTIFGDKQLKFVSSVLKDVVKEEGIIARIGGDEFSILFTNAKEETLMSYKESIIKHIFNKTSQNIELSVTIAYGVKEEVEQDTNEFFQSIENKMYAYKALDSSSSRNSAIRAILRTLNAKYEEERQHSTSVSIYSRQIGEKLGLDTDALKELEMAGLYHDIGKISIPDRVLKKPSKLTDKEFEVMKTHSEIGYRILRSADEYSDLAIYVKYHHERWDGHGYPIGLKATDIPLFSRIICIADAYEAMTSDRPYRKKLPNEIVLQEIVSNSGKQFDPTITEIFVKEILHEDWEELKKR